MGYEGARARLNNTSSTITPGTITYSYEQRGLKSGMTYTVNGENLIETSYSYDERSLLTQINATVKGHSIIWNRYYDELGRPLEDVLSTGIKTVRTFDANSNLTYLSNEYQNTKPLSRFELTHKPSGAITEIQKSFSRGGESGIGRYVLQYTYDELDRLITSSVDGAYTYDALGNITNRGGVYNLNNELLEDNDFIYSYTVNGELAQKISKETGEKTLYTWSIEGKLTAVMIKNSSDVVKTTINYAYDGLDRRVVKTVNNVTTKYAYDSEDIVAEFDETNKLKALYLHGPGIDDPIMMARDINKDEAFSEDELFFYSKDHLGSVHELTDINMKPIQRYNYLAYGETKLEKVDGQDKFVKSPYAYTSREWEEETGDYYYRARYYDPKASRFLSLDPIGFSSGDVNHYRYVNNNPMRFNDPNGNYSNDPSAGANTTNSQCYSNIISSVRKSCSSEYTQIKSMLVCTAGLCMSASALTRTGVKGLMTCLSFANSAVGASQVPDLKECAEKGTDDGLETLACELAK